MENNQRETNTMWFQLYIDSREKKLKSQTHIQKAHWRLLEKFDGEEGWIMVTSAQKLKISNYKIKSAKNIMYSMSIVNKFIIYFKFAKRLNLQSYYYMWCHTDKTYCGDHSNLWP